MHQGMGDGKLVTENSENKNNVTGVQQRSQNWKKMVWFVALLRILLPLTIFYSPIFALIASMALDGVDGTVVYLAKWKWRNYHYFDKTLDFWWYILILIYGLSIRIEKMIIVLFLYRALGQVISIILVYLNRESGVLLLFPNILENYFLLYLIGRWFPSVSDLYDHEIPIIPLIIASMIAIITEIRLHIKKKYAANYLFKRLGIDVNIVWKDNE